MASSQAFKYMWRVGLQLDALYGCSENDSIAKSAGRSDVSARAGEKVVGGVTKGDVQWAITSLRRRQNEQTHVRTLFE